GHTCNTSHYQKTVMSQPSNPDLTLRLLFNPIDIPKQRPIIPIKARLHRSASIISDPPFYLELYRRQSRIFYNKDLDSLQVSI
ncbi:hypothetical protein KAW04_03205, partial [Candidatus Bathyarchaeota archaeon]|nr:hypothetical protein [Candidatus Bathyarchaeota archaeon]